MISGVYRDRGKREVNGDSLALEEVCTDRGECVLMVVADGVGSLVHDEIVSGYVTECMVRWFYENGMWMSPWKVGTARRGLRRTALDCHLKLRQSSSINNFRWASTCTLVCIWRRRFICMQIGDSVCLKIGSKRIKSLSPRSRSGSGQLTACLGSGEFKEPLFSFGRIGRKDMLMVASDGMVDCFSQNEIQQMLSAKSIYSREQLERRLRSIGEEAGRRGATDNRSAVCICRGVDRWLR